MKATNYIKLEGNIGMDITTGATKNGKAWCRFPLGVNNVRLNRETGEYETTDTVWMWVSVFDKEAEINRADFGSIFDAIYFLDDVVTESYATFILYSAHHQYARGFKSTCCQKIMIIIFYQDLLTIMHSLKTYNMLVFNQDLTNSKMWVQCNVTKGSNFKLLKKIT